jgi:hypothetical protein
MALVGRERAANFNTKETVRVLESNGYGVREQQSWCSRVTVMELESNGYGVK